MTPAPNLVYQDLSLLFRILRDAFGADVDRLVLDSAEDYRKAHELLDFFGPTLKDRVHLYDGEKPLFEEFGVEQDIERLLKRRVWLKSGGYLIIDQAEALVAIDVNSGKFTGNTSGLNDTIVQTNLEAVSEIARQLRLRDLGGIIVLDLIDMANPNDRKKVETAFENALKKDRSRCKMSHLSNLGLIEMTRKRTGETVNEQMDEACPYCNGSGKIASPESVAIEVTRDLRTLVRVQPVAEAFVVTCSPSVAAYLVGDGGEEIEMLEHALERGIYVRSSEELHQEKYEIVGGRMDELDRKHLAVKRGQVLDVAVKRNALVAPPAATGYTESGLLAELPQGAKYVGQSVRVRLTKVQRSLVIAEPMGKATAIVGSGNSVPTAPDTTPPPPERERRPQNERRAAEPRPGEPASQGRTATTSDAQASNRNRRRQPRRGDAPPSA